VLNERRKDSNLSGKLKAEGLKLRKRKAFKSFLLSAFGFKLT
jgi:hypothetical protein